MPEITLEYLKSLNKPYEAINRELWEEMIKDIKYKMEFNNKFQYICLQSINNIAPQFGLVWNYLGDSKPCIEFINYTFDEMYNIKYTSDWFRKSVILTIVGLYELIDEDVIDDIYQKVFKYSPTEIKNLESVKQSEIIRNKINKFLMSERKNIKNENFDDIYKKFIKFCIKVLLMNGNFNTKEIKKYIDIMFYRFVYCMTFQEIFEKTGKEYNDSADSMGISSIIFKFCHEFKKAYSVTNDMKYLCIRFEKFYNTALEELDKTNLVERNNRLKGLKLFQKYFICENIADYVNLKDEDLDIEKQETELAS